MEESLTRERFTEILKEEGFNQTCADVLWEETPLKAAFEMGALIGNTLEVQEMSVRATCREMLDSAPKEYRA